MLDDQQGIAGVAQSVHDGDHAAHVARVQADRRLVEHKQRVDERGAERGGEIDALDLAAREGARLAVECQVAEANSADIPEPRPQFREYQFRGLVERRGQVQILDEVAALAHRHAHQSVDVGSARATQRATLRAEPPQQRIRLEPCAVAGRALRIAAVLRQQDADVHLVGLGLQPCKEAFQSIPGLLRPGAFAFDHPLAIGGGQLAPRHIERDAVALRMAHEIILAFLERGRLPGADCAGAEGLAGVGDHQRVVDADHTTEASALLAGADGGIE